MEIGDWSQFLLAWRLVVAAEVDTSASGARVFGLNSLGFLWNCPRRGRGMGVACCRDTTPQDLRARIDRFADHVTSFCRSVSPDPLLQPQLIQLLKSATSTAANYRAACRAQSRAAFVAKLSISLEEADESLSWLQRLTGQRIDC